MDRRGDRIFPSTACCFATITVARLLFFQVEGRLLVAPQNQVALLGESVQLDCATDLNISVNWEHTPLGSTKPIDVYLSRAVLFPYRPRFTVQREEVGVSITVYNLVVTDVQVEDAGTYRCTDRTGMGEKQSAELTVLGSLPNCTTNIGPNGFICENDCRHPIEKIHSSCSIEYTGNIAPDMKWMTTSGQDTIQSQPITNVSEKTVSSELNVEASESMNGASVLWYSMQSTQVKWTSAPIKTLYAKQILSPLTLSQSQFVTCSVNSSQHCDYSWIVKTHSDSELQTVKGRTLEVNKPGTYLCEANCPFRHTPCTVIAMHVEYSVPGNGNQYLIALVIIPFMVIAFIVICMQLRKNLPGSPSSKFGLLKSRLTLFLCPRNNQNDSSPLPQISLPPLQDPLVDSHSRTVSSGTPSSSNSTPLQSSGSDEPCLSKKSELNGNCKFSGSPAYEKEGLFNV